MDNNKKDPIDEARASRLYQVASQVIEGIPDYDSFKTALADPTMRQRIHGVIKDSNIIEGFPDYDAFNESLITQSTQEVSRRTREQTGALIDRTVGKIPQGVAAPPSSGLTQTISRSLAQQTRDPFAGAPVPDIRPAAIKKAEEVAATIPTDVSQQRITPTPEAAELSKTLGVPEELQKYTVDFLSDPYKFNAANSKATIQPLGQGVAWDERDVAEITGNAIAERGKLLNWQIDKIATRLPDEYKGIAQQAAALISQGKSPEQLLGQIPVSIQKDVNDLAYLYSEHRGVVKDINSFLEYFPNEAQRLRSIQETRDRNAARLPASIRPEHQALRQVGRGLLAAKDAGMQLLGSLYGAAKNITAVVTPFVGQEDVEQALGYVGIESLANSIGNAYDDYLRSYVDTQIFDKGEFKEENVVPAIAETATMLAAIIYSGGVASATLRGTGMSAARASQLGTFASGYMFSVDDFYKDAEAKGLIGEDKFYYASGSAFVAGLVEALAPSSFLTGKLARPTFDKALDLIQKGDLKARDVASYIIKQLPPELGEETAAILTQTGGNMVANAAFGTDFDDEITKDEFLSNVFLTTAGISLLGAIRGKQGIIEEQQEYANYLRDNKAEFEKWTIDAVTNDRITREEALQLATYIDNMTSPQARAEAVLDATDPVAKQAEELLGREKATYDGKSLTITERREAEDGTVQVRGTYDDGTTQEWVNAEDVETEEFSSMARDLEALLPDETPEGATTIQPAPAQPAQTEGSVTPEQDAALLPFNDGDIAEISRTRKIKGNTFSFKSPTTGEDVSIELTDDEKNRITKASTFVDTRPIIKEIFDRKRQEITNKTNAAQPTPAQPTRGRKQVNRGFDDLDKATTPEARYNAIQSIENNAREGAELSSDEQERVNQEKAQLKADGFDVVDMDGLAFEEGMKVTVQQAIPDDTLAEGEEVISRIVSPQINKDGEMVQAATVVLTVGTNKEGGLTREQWLEERDRKRQGKKTQSQQVPEAQPKPTTPTVNETDLSSPDPTTKANAVFEAKQANPDTNQQKAIAKAERELKKGKVTTQEKTNVIAKDEDVTTTDATEQTELTEEQYDLLEKADKTKDVVIITGTTRPMVLQNGQVQQTGQYEGIRIPADKAEAILAANAEKQKIRRPSNKAELTETLKTVFKLPADQADAAADIIDRMIGTMAARAKKTKQDIYASLRFQRGVDRKVPANAKAAMLKRGALRIIAALQDPDVSSPLHELAHVFEDFLSPDEQATVIKYAKSRGQKGDAWTRETSEAFAEGFERYLREGRAPSTGIQKIFDQFKDWIRTIASGTDVLNPQMREIYDLMIEEGQISRAAQITKPEKGSLAKGRKPIKSNRAEVGDIVTYKGENWFVTAVEGDTYRLRSEDLKRTASTKKFDEKLESPKEPIQDGDTVLFDGQEVKVTVTDKEYIIDGKQIGKNIKYKYPRNKLNDAMFNAAKERHAAQKQADDAKGEMLLQTGTDLNTAIRDFADKWIRANGSLSPAKFKRMLPAKVQKAITDEDLRALFESTPAYLALQERRKIQQQARGEASFGTEQRKSAERLIDKTDIDQSTKDKIKARGLRYFSESVNQSEQQVLQWIETVGLDEATNMFLAESGRSDSFLDTMSGNDLPGHLQVFLGIELIRQHNQLKNNEKAAEVAIRLAEIGTTLGRGVNAFKGITMLTGEGLTYAFGRLVNNAKEGLKEKYRNRIQQTVNKYNDAKAKAARDTASSLLTDKTWIQEGKERVLRALKGETDILFQTGIDTKVRPNIIRFGMFLVLEGNTDFTKWSGKMKTQFGLTDAQTLEIWDSKYDGVNTVKDLGVNPHFANAVVNNIDNPAKLTEFFDSVGVYQGNKLAESINKAYKQRVAKEFAKQANKAERAFVQILASGDELDVTKIQEGYIAAAGFVGLDPELEALIQKTNEILTKSPTYAMKEAAVQRLMNAAFKKMGREPVGKYAMAAMYFNMLSGLPTHLVNLVTSVTQVTEDIIGQSFLAPLIDVVTRGSRRLRLLTPVRSNTAEVARATRLGARLGVSNAKDILFSGRLSQVQGQKYELPNLPERFSWAADVMGNLHKMAANAKGGNIPAAFSDLLQALVGGYFTAAKYSARAMDAADALARTPVMVSYYVVASEHLASREFMDSGPTYQEVVKDLQARGTIQGDPRSEQNEPIVRKAIADRIRGWASGDIETLWTKLRQEVEDDLRASGLPFTPQDVDNGTMERFAPDYRVKDIAERKANRSVFRQKPEGSIGAIAEALNSLSRKFPPTSLVVPFTNILANVTNTWLDYFPPVAIMRATGISPSAVVNKMFNTNIPDTSIQGSGKFTRDLEEQIIRRNELLYRATVGMVAGVIAALALGGEDEEGYSVLTGGGPKDYKKKKELESRGYAWYSIRVPGIGYVSYQYLPVGATLSFVGNYFDLLRYGTEKEKENAIASAVMGFPSFMLNATFLAGLSDFFKTLSQSDKFTTAETVASTASRQLSKFVPFNAMLNNAEAAMGYDQPELVGWQMTFRAIPFVRGIASDRPSLDHFGRPISKQVKEGILGNAMYHFVGTKRFYKPKIELDATEKLFQEKNYYTPEITGAFTINKVPIESDPILEYDVHKYTQRLFKQQADNLAQNYATLDEESFEKAMDKIHKNCREAIRQSFMLGMTPAQIEARYGLEDKSAE